jgi:hypothetical protein
MTAATSKPKSLTKDRSVAEEARKASSSWEKKLEKKLGATSEDAAAILQISKHELGLDDHDYPADKRKQVFKMCRQISAEFGYDATKKKTKKPSSTKTTSSKKKTNAKDDSETRASVSSEPEMTEATEGVTESERSEDDIGFRDRAPVSVKMESSTTYKKNKTSSKKKKTKKVRKRATNDMDVMEDLEDQVSVLQGKLDSLESKMNGLATLNERMASDLGQVLEYVSTK